MRHNSWRPTKYYRFNGQVVAMRKNGVLTYLHGDHLGSTFATTNSSGNFSGQEWYHAYGRYRGGHELGTENRFTGQKLDGAGLMYFNARYYDPELGQFISPDTIVPDPTNLFDYNRYVFVRGNPMKFVDPTGHCTTLDDGSRDMENDAQCWRFVDAIGASWDQNTGWWQKAFYGYDKGSWMQTFSTQEAFDQNWMQGVLVTYLNSDSYQSLLYGPQFEPGAAPKHPLETLGNTVCGTWDCPAIGLDVASIGLSIGGDAAIGCAIASAGVAAGVCIPATAVAKGADFTVTNFSVARTWKMYYDGNASLVDGLVSSTTGAVSFLPGAGEAAGIVQLGYDLADPALSIFIPNRGAK